MVTFDRADVRFARPNIQIYDAHVVDLGQSAGARYLVGVSSAETKGKAQLCSALDRMSKRIMLAFQILAAQKQSGGHAEKRYFPYISI
jgi:hypothetical protein